MVRSGWVLFLSHAPITLLHKLYIRLGITLVMSIRTKCASVCASLKNVPVMERPYKCIHTYIPPMHKPPRVCT